MSHCVQMLPCRRSGIYAPCVIVVLKDDLMWNIPLVSVVDNRFLDDCRQQVICSRSKPVLRCKHNWKCTFNCEA